MGQISETSAYPLFLICFYFLKHIVLTSNQTESERHTFNDFNIVVFLYKFLFYTSLFVVLLHYENGTFIWPIFFVSTIYLHKFRIFYIFSLTLFTRFSGFVKSMQRAIIRCGLVSFFIKNYSALSNLGELIS